jgi:Uma2 family endonuclease
LVARTAKGVKYLDGPPVLAIEVLSPADKHEQVSKKIKSYLRAGVKLVWIVDADACTVTVHRPDAKPQMFNVEQQLTADPHLPGFRCSVAEIFD